MTKPIDLGRIKPQSLKKRKNKVSVDDFAVLPRGQSFAAFWQSLPHILAGDEIRAVVHAMENARRKNKPILWLMGAHVVKVGLAPMLIDLMRLGYVSSISLNGAGVIHDVEVALIGGTSEDVAEGIRTGTFGMSHETSQFINTAVREGAPRGLGFGESVCARLETANPPFADRSLLCSARRLGIPVTVHIAMGTDIVHVHPSFDPAAAGEASHRDFRIVADLMKSIGDGGVILNVGSSVILPLIVEKSLAVVRNMGLDVRRFTGVNLDFIQHYRSNLNPVKRARELDGRGISITGHHELTLPIIYWAIRTGVERPAKKK